MDLASFAEAVGSDDPVTCRGSGTRWAVGGVVDPSARVVAAPAGLDWVQPDEMTVCCGAGTPVADLDAALGDVGQQVALPTSGTVGGVLAVGRSGVRRLGDGPVRDALLQARVVTATGEVVKAGGPTVKNVSGFDLCRLLVGSLGTLAFLGEVILRTRPRPACSQWFAGPVDPFEARARLYRPVSVLWDGTTTWVWLEGHPADVTTQVALFPGLAEADGPPSLPTGGRASCRPGGLKELTGRFVAEIGVGVVHREEPVPERPLEPNVRVLHERLKVAFDRSGRLNPGRGWR